MVSKTLCFTDISTSCVDSWKQDQCYFPSKNIMIIQSWGYILYDWCISLRTSLWNMSFIDDSINTINRVISAEPSIKTVALCTWIPLLHCGRWWGCSTWCGLGDPVWSRLSWRWWCDSKCRGGSLIFLHGFLWFSIMVSYGSWRLPKKLQGSHLLPPIWLPPFERPYI